LTGVLVNRAPYLLDPDGPLSKGLPSVVSVSQLSPLTMSVRAVTLVSAGVVAEVVA
jgi:hypothetical protein